ncbi:uncharacterized protein CANTADRAFT_91552 [Suhomyces tanzawaensis NRRL Y-17324]|uniref:RRM domain-containing protein n=1 Tax=Suhomyces tanzawaensis NRRL Y-17324 TaxID=984487 RepID=A0A1E4SFE3_9ASCO|nr:uncharacterized protein CANTADRAFT_91552 [Suhomyces tanzawaensis NRRL Y-17324]ODV78122.1 hypothetical protein CANTADRAFT_91552 [Suhomyces tanzawaensis NRRL Y-17324]
MHQLPALSHLQDVIAPSTTTAIQRMEANPEPISTGHDAEAENLEVSEQPDSLTVLDLTLNEQIQPNESSVTSGTSKDDGPTESSTSSELHEASNDSKNTEIVPSGTPDVVKIDPSSIPEVSIEMKKDESLSDGDVPDTFSKASPSEDEEEYDPEVALQESVPHQPENPNPESPNDDNDVNSSALSDLENHEKPEEQNDEDDYDPEIGVQAKVTKPVTSIPPKPPASTLPAKPVGLPPKPPVNVNHTHVSSTNTLPISPPNPQNNLKEAYDAIMQSELVKDPNFINLSQQEQMTLIMEQLKKNNVHLSGTASAENSNANYDQVYSYNKPFKSLKSPIPLVPVNEFCRRPNITKPMSTKEQHDYDEFVKREAYYMGLQNWDEFPDKLRLFIGNLPANTISKQDLFRIFSQYGEVIQIAIKAGYGFAQFRTAESCLDCIRGETNVPLHNKIMRLDASRPQKSKRNPRSEPISITTSRGRERSPDEGPNKRRNIVPDCQIYTTGKSSIFFLRRVKKAFSNLRININTEDITHRELSDVISEAAYSGVLGVCIVKDMNVDVQTFESTPDGGVKFDEYADVEPEVAADIIYKSRVKKYGEETPVSQSFEEPEFSNNGGSRRGVRDRGERDRRGGRNHRHTQYPPSGWAAGNPGSNRPYEQVPYGNPIQSNYAKPPNPNFSTPQPPYSAYAQSNYQQPYQQPYQSYPPVLNNQSELIQAIQGLDPNSAQNVLHALQNQQNQQHQQHQLQHQPQNIAYGRAPQPSNYNNFGPGQQFNHQAPPNASSPNNQVNSLLSQLQSGSSSYPPQNQAEPGSTQALMETLARLSRK